MGRKPPWIVDEWPVVHPDAKACKTCIYRPSYDGEYILDRDDTDICTIFYAPARKPDDVYWRGAKCDHFKRFDRKPESILLGLAVGDALGVPVEFKKRGSYQITGMTGHGTYNQPPGTWSDDTSLALILADNLGSTEIFYEDFGRSMINWLEKGEYTARGEVFDVGNATAKAIKRMRDGVPAFEAGGKAVNDNGNGGLMRIAPLALYMINMPPRERYETTKKVSSITHAHLISVTACFIYLETFNLLLKGREKDVAYAEMKQRIRYDEDFLDRDALGNFDRILNANIADLKESEIKSSGYVVDTLEAALWCFLTAGDYREAVLKAVNLGEDTDTVGAVTGALAGLYYGVDAIPEEWLDVLAKRKEIEEIAIKMPRWDLFPNA